MREVRIDFGIIQRSFIEDYYTSSEYYAVPFHEFVRICKENNIDPTEWYKRNVSKQLWVLVGETFSGRELKEVLEDKIDLPNSLYNSYYSHLFIKYMNNYYEIFDDNVGLIKYCSYDNNQRVLNVFLVLDDQPEGIALIEGTLRFYFNSREAGSHHKPHVHIKYERGQEVVMDILTGEVLEGKFPNTKLLREAKEIIINNRPYFVEWWNTKTDGLKIDINYALGITHFLNIEQ